MKTRYFDDTGKEHDTRESAQQADAKNRRAGINYANPSGLWHVTTEGDCEGKSITDLGTHEGFLDVIAHQLAYKSYYSLQFTRVNPASLTAVKSNTKSVNVTLDIASGTWKLSNDERVEFFNSLLKDRPVTVTNGTSYASVTLNF